MKKALFLMLSAFIVFNYSYGQQAYEQPRYEEKFIRFEEGLKNVQTRLETINKRYDELRQEVKDLRQDIRDLRQENRQMYDDLKMFMLWGFGILFSGMGILIPKICRSFKRNRNLAGGL